MTMTVAEATASRADGSGWLMPLPEGSSQGASLLYSRAELGYFCGEGSDSQEENTEGQVKKLVRGEEQ